MEANDPKVDSDREVSTSIESLRKVQDAVVHRSKALLQYAQRRFSPLPQEAVKK